MFIKLVGMIRSWWSNRGAEIESEVNALSTMITERVTEAARDRRNLERSLERFNRIKAQVEDNFRTYDKTIDRLEGALSTSKDELRRIQEVTLPGLIASHEVLVSRWEAETKVNVMRGSLLEDRGGET